MRAHIVQVLINMFIHLSQSGLFLLLKVIPMICSILITQGPAENKLSWIISQEHQVTIGFYMCRELCESTTVHASAQHRTLWGKFVMSRWGAYFLAVNKTPPTESLGLHVYFICIYNSSADVGFQVSQGLHGDRSIPLVFGVICFTRP